MNVHQKANWLVAGVLGIFFLLRLMLWLSPNSDFNVFGYNIHHLFTGLVMITLSAPFVILSLGSKKLMTISLLVFGAGLGMALDEWVYLIVTDGSNASYLLPVSFWGGLVAVLLAAAWIMLLARFYGKNQS